MISNNSLAEVNEYKYLGVTITNNLNWNTHIRNICASAFRKLCQLRHKLKDAPTHVKYLAYTTLIRPKLEYACTVWDPYTKVNINNLEKIQRRAVRFIYSNYNRLDSVSQLMNTNKIQTLELRRKFFRLKFLHQLVNKKLGLDSSLYVNPLSTRTRHTHDKSLTPFFARTNYFKFSFFPRTVAEWNSLPSSALSSVESLEAYFSPNATVLS